MRRLFGKMTAVGCTSELGILGFESARWGESPVAFLTLRNGADATEEELKAWVNSRVGSIQRVIRLMAVPRWWWSKKLKSYFMRQFSRTAGFGAPVRRASGVYSSIL